jgi:hypothetical protein
MHVASIASVRVVAGTMVVSRRACVNFTPRRASMRAFDTQRQDQPPCASRESGECVDDEIIAGRYGRLFEAKPLEESLQAQITLDIGHESTRLLYHW